MFWDRLNDRLFRRHIDDDEVIHAIVHKHWVVGIKFLYLPLLLILFSWIIAYQVPFRELIIAVLLSDVILGVWFLRNFFDYYLDAWIITNQGIIDVAWHGWFHRQSTRVLYSDIQGVSYEIQGVTSTLLRYGTVSVEKISSGSVISLAYVAQPRTVESIILKNMEAYLHTKNLKDASHVQDILSSLVAREVQLDEFE